MTPLPPGTVLAQELAPILRRVAQQLTLLNCITSVDEFWIEWLGEPRHRLSHDGLELIALVGRLEPQLDSLRETLRAELRSAFSERDRWRANAHVSAVSSMLRDLTIWSRRAGWIHVEFE